MKVVVLSDTHVRDTGARDLPDAAWRALEFADVILHAGDVVERGLLDRIRALGVPLHAVLGNNDGSLHGVLPERWEGTVAGVRIGMVHDTGGRAGREIRVKRLFPDADVVVFGHSHIPWNAEGVGGQLLLNPGSPTERRSQPSRTIAVLDLADGAVRSAEIVVVD